MKTKLLNEEVLYDTLRATENYLKMYGYYKNQVAITNEIISTLKANNDGLHGMDFSDAPRTAGTGSPVERAVLKTDDKIEKLRQEIIRCYEEMDYIIGVICSVDDVILEQLLYYRYVSGQNWNQISRAMSYCVDHVRGRLHRQALLSVYDRLVEDNKIAPVSERGGF